MKNKREIAILMATYNGEKYLSQQIDSIIDQSFSDWTLYIHDDGSNDGTIELIHQYCKKDDRIVFIDRIGKHLGPGYGFMELLHIVESDLYMFCDQDDVWLKDKIRITFDTYHSIPKFSIIPVVVHSDVSVVDEDLNIMARSYWKDINLNPDKINTFDYLCVSCYTNGNTMLFNSAAKELCFPLIDEIIMHDKYVSSRVLLHGGVVQAIHVPLVLYRQHGKNVCGFRVGKETSIFERVKHLPQVFTSNINEYRLLKNYEFGSFLRFIFIKIKLEIKMHFFNQY